MSEDVVFLRRFSEGTRDKLHGRSTEAVVSREAYGVRGACSRCRMCGAVRKREQAPRTPYASRGLVPVMPAWGQTRPTRRCHRRITSTLDFAGSNGQNTPMANCPIDLKLSARQAVLHA